MEPGKYTETLYKAFKLAVDTTFENVPREDYASVAHSSISASVLMLVTDILSFVDPENHEETIEEIHKAILNIYNREKSE